MIFQTIQFSSIWPINRTLSGATTPDQSEPWSDGNEVVLHISLSSNITGTSQSDWLVSHAEHSLGESYLSAEMQSVYSAAPTNWVTGYSLEESYPSAEIQSVYSPAPANWARGHSLGESYPSAEIPSVYSTALPIGPLNICGNHPKDFGFLLSFLILLTCNIWDQRVFWKHIKLTRNCNVWYIKLSLKTSEYYARSTGKTKQNPKTKTKIIRNTRGFNYKKKQTANNPRQDLLRT